MSKIRDALLGDAPGIVALMRSLSVDEPHLLYEQDEVPDTGRLVRTISSSATDKLYVALRSGRVAGYAAVRLGAFRRVKGVGGLAMGVASGARQQGLGSALLRHVLVSVRAIGLHRVELKVSVENTEAVKLYHKYGFRPEGVAKAAAMVAGKPVDKLLMALIIEPPVR